MGFSVEMSDASRIRQKDRGMALGITLPATSFLPYCVLWPSLSLKGLEDFLRGNGEIVDPDSDGIVDGIGDGRCRWDTARFSNPLSAKGTVPIHGFDDDMINFIEAVQPVDEFRLNPPSFPPCNSPSAQVMCP
jgi:hypothetical protein